MCHDTTGLGGGTITLTAKAGMLAIAYQPGTIDSQTGLRTRCPGPGGPQQAIASARVPLSTLRERTTRIVLTRGRRFFEDGYSGLTVPRLTLTLIRVRVRTHRVSFFTS